LSQTSSPPVLPQQPLDRLKPLPQQPLDRLKPLRGLQAREARPEHLKPDRGHHPVQAERGGAGFERVPQHQPRVIDPAGIPPPAGEPLGQLGLPRPPGTGQDHRPLQPGRGLQLVEQVITAHEHAARRGQRLVRDGGLQRGGPDLIQRLVQ
jgi:hypothetical protein